MEDLTGIPVAPDQMTPLAISSAPQPTQNLATVPVGAQSHKSRSKADKLDQDNQNYKPEIMVVKTWPKKLSGTIHQTVSPCVVFANFNGEHMSTIKASQLAGIVQINIRKT